MVTLDPDQPLSMGVYAAPAYYQEFRMDLHSDLEKSAAVISDAGKRFGQVFGRSYGLVEEYHVKDAKEVLVGLGSAMENVKAAVDEMRKQGKKVGALHVRVLRPFPREELRRILSGKHVGVIDRALSPGAQPPLFTEIVEALQGTSSTVSSFFGALGGRTLKIQESKQLFEKMSKGKALKEWITVTVEKNEAEIETC